MSLLIDKNNTSVKEFLEYFSWFEENFCDFMKKSCENFWKITPQIRLFSLEKNSKNFFAGNYYYVTQAQINGVKFFVRLSDSLCEELLHVSLGENDNNFFSLKTITELENNIIFQFNNILIKETKNFLQNKKDVIKLQDRDINFDDYIHLGFILKSNHDFEDGKILISIPQNLLKLPNLESKYGNSIDTTKFKKAQTLVDIYVGKTKLSLDDINSIEPEDIVVLENSDIKKMAVVYPTHIDFNVNPDPRLFINDDNDDTEEQMEDIEVSTKDIWDNVQVDVCAKFPKVKMSLGELREMTEGVVMELDSVYGNEVILEVENKNVAKGELVIVGYKYGVKITEICAQTDDEVDNVNVEASSSNDDFDVKDFEIEE